MGTVRPHCRLSICVSLLKMSVQGLALKVLEYAISS